MAKENDMQGANQKGNGESKAKMAGCMQHPHRSMGLLAWFCVIHGMAITYLRAFASGHWLLWGLLGYGANHTDQANPVGRAKHM